MLAEIVKIAMQKGIQFGTIQLIDSVHSNANVNTAKDKTRVKDGKEPRDPNARWGTKHKRKVKNEKGEEFEQTEHYYGFKTHVSLNAETGLSTKSGRNFWRSLRWSPFSRFG